MPRPASALWTHFRRDGPTKRAVCKYCGHNMCGLVSRMRSHLARKCGACPALVKSDMFEQDASRKAEAASTASTASASTASTASAPVAKKPRRRGASAGGVPTVDGKADDLDALVAQAVLGAALPVAVVESAGFVRLLKRLAPPNYEPPSAFALATSALDAEYTETQLRLRAEVLDASAVCLGVESWAAARLRPVVSCVVHNTSTPGVFSLETTGELPHTAEVLVDKVESVMTQIGTGRVAVVVADMTTSDAMKQATLTLQTKYPNITFLPSCAHAMNAMVADLLALAPVHKVLLVVHDLARFLAKHHASRAALARISEQMQGLEPGSSSSVESTVSAVLLSPAWTPDSMDAPTAAAAAAATSSPSSYYYGNYGAYTPASIATPASSVSPIVALERLLSVHHHRHSLDILLAHQDVTVLGEGQSLNELPGSTKEQLLRLSFWEDLSALVALLEPFLDLLRTFDADYPLLSTFYHRFTLLWGHVDKYAGATAGGSSHPSVHGPSNAGGLTSSAVSGGSSVSEPLPGSASTAMGPLAARIQRIMTDHWRSIEHPAIYTAYMLDPRFPAGSLSPEATGEVLSFLKRGLDANLYSSVVTELTRFTSRADLFADDTVWDSAHKCGPINWWKGFIGGSCPNLQSIALRTLCYPASSGLSRARRDMVDRIQAANARIMNDEQAAKAAVVYLNATLAAAATAAAEEEATVANETIV